MYRDDLIRAQRAAKKLTQQQVADKSKVNINTYRAIENGKENIEVSTLQKVADALGLPMNHLFEPHSSSVHRLAA